MFDYILPMILAATISLLATPVARKLAYRIGAVDVPKDNRRVHKEPIPRMGGLAIYVAAISTFLFFCDFSFQKTAGILIGSAMIVVMGVFDDVKALPAKLKLLIQIAAAFVLIFSGFQINFFTNWLQPDQLVYLSWLSIPVTLVWIVGITNTVNLIDGLDGLATGVSITAALALAYVAHANGFQQAATLTMIIAGACLGFLPHNFNPAKIFMGDTGSLFLGYMLAVISILGSLKSATALLVPIIALGLPIFDTTFAIVRRYLSGQPIMEADKGHLHHRLLHIGLSQKRAVLLLYLKSGLFGLGAVLLANQKYLNGFAVLFAVAILILIPINMTLDITKKKSEGEEQK